jgi:hypothetical protein
MIDSSFIIKYTDALYSTPPESAPRYDEFRDMFSSGQIYSKEWVVRELARIDSIHQGKSFIVAGAWFGTLGMMIKWRFPSVNVTMLDIDPRCERFIHSMIYSNPSLKTITDDIYLYSYTEDVIINTSCEHIDNVQDWLSLLPADRMVVLQSNNYIGGNGHINCVHSKEEFVEQTGLSDILYSGELVMPMYTRYMVIGKT